jgi:microcystin-dependent protein
MASWTREYVTYGSHQRPIVGDTKFSAVNQDHVGWLKCDGRALQVSDYYFLWQVIGYSFGSNTSNDFKLPNPAGRVPGVIGAGAGLTSRSLGDTLGEETHVLTVAEMPTHNHGVTDPGHTHTYLGVNSQSAASGVDNVAENSPRPTETTGSNTTGISINNTGGSNAHNNMQPTIYMGNMFMYSGNLHYGTYPQSLNANIY